jgi:hypothetical protein
VPRREKTYEGGLNRHAAMRFLAENGECGDTPMFTILKIDVWLSASIVAEHAF